MELRAEKELVTRDLSDLHPVVIPACELHTFCFYLLDKFRIHLISVPVSLDKRAVAVQFACKRTRSKYSHAITQAHGAAHIFDIFLLWQNVYHRILCLGKL